MGPGFAAILLGVYRWQEAGRAGWTGRTPEEEPGSLGDCSLVVCRDRGQVLGRCGRCAGRAGWPGRLWLELQGGRRPD